jgi:hypothetical protein
MQKYAIYLINPRCSTYSSSENTTCSFLVQAAHEKLKEDRETEAPMNVILFNANM